jgi:amidophosphoribosyltransferase
MPKQPSEPTPEAEWDSAEEEGLGLIDEDHPKDECGVFGVFNHPEAANISYLGLYALQHRGQEGTGIVSCDNGKLRKHGGVGLVSDVFSSKKPHRLEKLKGNSAIGHVRYSTFGSSKLKNVQPLVCDYKRGSMAVAHNGNLVNAGLLREELEEEGQIFHSTTDTEVIMHLAARSKQERFVDCIIEGLKPLIGAYSLVATNGKEVIAARDPLGFRPLWIGRLGESWILSSETCSLDIIDAEWVREVEPGEVVVVNSDGLESLKPFEPVQPRPCMFEFVYVARPDSYIFGKSVDEVRKEFGRRLARESAVDADVVMALPDSSNQAALGYAMESGIPFDMGLIRNHYVGRTFIEPDQSIRDFGVRLKLNASRTTIEGKRIVLIDDSIVRGTTSRKIIKMLKRCGAKEIHFRISSPPIINSCHYGIDTPVRDRLIASQKSVDQVRDYLGVNSLAHLSLEGMVEATGMDKAGFCLACFNNEYPTKIPSDFDSGKVSNRHEDISTDLIEMV